MDAVGKRIVFFQAVTVLQVAKIYQWYMHSWTWQTVGFWQWLFVDIMVLLYASRASLKFPVSQRLVYLGLFSFFIALNLTLAHTAVSIVISSLLFCSFLGGSHMATCLAFHFPPMPFREAPFWPLSLALMLSL